MRVCLVIVASFLLSSPAMAGSAERPGLSEIWQAAWRLESIVGSFQSDTMRDADLDALDPTFDAWQASEGTEYRRYPAQLGRLLSRQAYDVWTSQIDRELRDRRTLEVAH